MSKQDDANKRQVGGNHYSTSPCADAMQHWDWCWQNSYDQFQYCITKYVHRHRLKDGVRDLEKALHHLEKYIEVVKAEQEEMRGYVNQD
jgi:hypothetical protein